jgi:hypothetical protein
MIASDIDYSIEPAGEVVQFYLSLPYHRDTSYHNCPCCGSHKTRFCHGAWHLCYDCELVFCTDDVVVEYYDTHAFDADQRPEMEIVEEHYD